MVVIERSASGISAPPEAIRVATLSPEVEERIIDEVDQLLLSGRTWLEDKLWINEHRREEIDTKVAAENRATGVELPKEELEPQKVTLDQVKKLPNLSPRFEEAAYWMCRDGTLERVCIFLVQNSVVTGKTEEEAIANSLVWLNQRSLEKPEGPVFITRADTQRRIAPYAKLEAKRLVGQIDKSPEKRLVTTSGAVQHMIAHMADGHYVYDPTKYRSKLELTPREGEQATLFRRDPKDKSYWNPLKSVWMLPGKQHLNEVSMFGHVSWKFAHKIGDTRDELWQLRARRRNGEISAAHYMYEAIPRAYALLHQFAAIYPPDVLYRLVESDSMAARYVLVETMLAASNKFLDATGQDRKLIRQELQALSVADFGNPRIDGLMLKNGKPLGDDAHYWLKDSKFRSAGQAIHDFRRMHGEGNQWIVERKTRLRNSQELLGVDLFKGDRPSGSAEFTLVGESDLEQLDDYISLVQYDLFRYHRQGSPWQGSIQGVIEVLTADSPPYTEFRTKTPEEQRERFRTWMDFEHDPVIRGIATSRDHMNYLVACAKAAVKRREKADDGESLVKPRQSHKEVIGSDWEFAVDPNDFLNKELRLGRKVGTNRSTGETFYEFSFKAIVEGIKAGVIKSRNYSPSRKDFFIRCISDAHISTKNFTMQVNLEKCRVKCFSCGAWGRLDPETVPVQFADRVKSFKALAKEAPRSNEVLMSEEHLAFMQDLQKAFQKYFKGSRGESYIRSRGIDPEEAFRLGAGYGDSRVIKDLIDGKGFSRKWTVPEMVKYGLIGIREHETDVDNLGNNIVDLLMSLRTEKGGRVFKSRADALKRIDRGGVEFRVEIDRPDGKTEWRTEKITSPDFTVDRPGKVVALERYFKWNGRVTFPLVWGGRVTGFYGRATWKFSSLEAKNKGAHRKIKVEREIIEMHDGTRRWTNPAQGAFNGEVLQKKNLKYVVVTEGVFDTLSLMAMGIENVVGIIGTYNDISIEEIAALGIPVYIALDGDMPGSLNAFKIYRKLRASGLKEPIYNFTPELFKAFAQTSEKFVSADREPRLVTEDDLVLYRLLQNKYRDAVKGIEDAGFPKDHNELLLTDRAVAREIALEILRAFTPEHQITRDTYERIFDDSRHAMDVLVKHGYSAEIVENSRGLVYRSN